MTVSIKPARFVNTLHNLFRLGATEVSQEKEHRQNLAYELLRKIDLSAPEQTDVTDAEALDALSEIPSLLLQPMKEYVGENLQAGLPAARSIMLRVAKELIHLGRDPAIRPLYEEWRNLSPDHSQDIPFLNNLDHLFTEVCEIAAITQRDFVREYDREPNKDERVWIAADLNKIVLNIASSHNAVGGSVLHFCLEAARQEKPVFSFTTGQVLYHPEFMNFTLKQFGVYLGLIQKHCPDGDPQHLYDLIPEDRSPSRPLDVCESDVYGSAFLFSNLQYGNKRMGCPFLRAKQLPSVVSGMLQNLFRPK